MIKQIGTYFFLILVILNFNRCGRETISETPASETGSPSADSHLSSQVVYHDYDSDGDIDAVVTQTFDSNENLTQMTYDDEMNSDLPDSTSKFYYDSNNNLVKFTADSDNDGVVDMTSTFTYSYDSSNRKAKIKNYTDGELSYEETRSYDYDDEREMYYLLSTYYDADGLVTSISISYYDDEEKYEKLEQPETGYILHEDSFVSMTHEFDSYGNEVSSTLKNISYEGEVNDEVLLEMIEAFEAGSLDDEIYYTLNTTYTFQYDSHGNKLSEIKESEGYYYESFTELTEGILHAFYVNKYSDDSSSSLEDDDDDHYPVTFDCNDSSSKVTFEEGGECD